MSKQCSICSPPDEALTKVLELHKLETSQQKIVKTIQEVFSITVSASALNRHFNNCREKQSNPRQSRFHLLKEKMKIRSLKGIDIHRAICNILSEEIENFICHLNEREVTSASRLENLKCLDVLINMILKLYPER